MKSLFPYVILVALFLAGTWLVNRQQTYFRSLQDHDSANVYVRADYSPASGRK
ncbi:hypothetical protein [Spirosoma foliorum]|uniref:Uncharacterized protein n=1 Tax=Spirosoma foliorum TaxID=2710596 RepID=A0A7G5GQE3_9BACT|nr:hypothetical protein [Spirosoma foliorum]QMW01085.1 hypothetical protein H3H32_24345 [Spirosoma foliorum]